MILGGEIGLGEPIVDERLRERNRSRRRDGGSQLQRAVEALGANRPAQRALAAIWDRLILAEVHRLGGAPRANPHHGLLLDAIFAGDEAEAADAARRHVLVDAA